jgi:predicted transcriptional regulator
MPKVNLVTRIESNLKDRLGEAAKVQNRTTSNMVEWLIKQYLEQLTNRNVPSPDAFDAKIAADAEAGKLDFLLDAAQREYDAGKLHFQ